MLMTLRILRGIVGFIAIWQIIGLLPVLTNWLPNASATTGNMWAIAFVKFLVFLICSVAFYWLGRIKKRYEKACIPTTELPAIGIALVVVLVVGLAAAFIIPTLNRQSTVTAPSLNSEGQPAYDSKGWTEENTGIDFILEETPPAGARYYRNAQGIIYRIYPPGVRPDLPTANPFGVGDSTAGLPPRG